MREKSCYITVFTSFQQQVAQMHQNQIFSSSRRQLDFISTKKLLDLFFNRSGPTDGQAKKFSPASVGLQLTQLLEAELSTLAAVQLCHVTKNFYAIRMG